MPYDLDLQLIADGVYAWLEANPGAVAEARLKRIARAAHKQAMVEFAAGGIGGKREHSIAHRFSESYGHRVLRRSDTYEARVRKFYGGRYLPFSSPSKAGYKGGGHLRDRIKQQGTGYRVQGRNGTELVTTSLILPAARILNLRPLYRPQFLALTTTNAVDGQALEVRVGELMLDALRNEINRTKARYIKMAKAVAQEITV